jgi:hypothetical protein
VLPSPSSRSLSAGRRHHRPHELRILANAIEPRIALDALSRFAPTSQSSLIPAIPPRVPQTMWPTLRLNSAMSSPPAVAHGRPWTPPDTDSEYFIDPFATGSATSDDLADSWPNHSLVSPRRPKPTSSATEPYYSVKSKKNGNASAHVHSERVEYLSDVSPHTSTPVKRSHARPHLDSHRYASAPAPAPALYSPVEEHYSHPVHAHGSSPSSGADPHTPVKALRTPDPHTRKQNGIPQYPYTPDSARTTRTYPLPGPLSPLPPMPWERRKESSPMQSALSSCISHLENLIDTRQPNDEQMEYLVTKFEEMAQFLSAPEAQSRQSDDHLFSELDIPSGLGITGVIGDDEDKADELHIGVGYIQEVGRYIDGVKKHAEDLKMRMEEVKLLNSIQVDIIEDLRRELRTTSPQTKEAPPQEDEKDEEEEEAPGTPQEPPTYPPQRTGFWAAVGEALDSVGETLLEW